MITDVRYTVDPGAINIDYDDEPMTTMDWPSGTWRDAQVQAWIDLGNTIAPYDPYYGWSVDEAKQIKANEVRGYADSLLNNAWSNPETELLDIDPTQWRRTVESRRDERNDIKADEGTLTNQQRAEAKSDMRLGEYGRRISVAENNTRPIIDAGTIVEDIMALNPETMITWPTWVPYDNPV